MINSREKFSFASLLCSCGQKNSFNNSMPSEKFAIDYVVDETTNKVRMECDFDFAANEVDLFHLTDSDERVGHLIGGDVLRVYYADEGKKTVDHVLASPASLIEVTNDIVPGSDSYMQIHSDEHPIGQSGIAYVINEDLSLTYLSDVDAGIVNACYNVRVFNLPLTAYREKDHFKLYMGDTGLLISMLDPGAIYKSSIETSAFAKARSSRASSPKCFGRAGIRLISLLATICLRLISSFPRTGS